MDLNRIERAYIPFLISSLGFMKTDPRFVLSEDLFLAKGLGAAYPFLAYALQYSLCTLHNNTQSIIRGTPNQPFQRKHSLIIITPVLYPSIHHSPSRDEPVEGLGLHDKILPYAADQAVQVLERHFDTSGNVERVEAGTVLSQTAYTLLRDLRRRGIHVRTHAFLVDLIV